MLFKIEGPTVREGADAYLHTLFKIDIAVPSNIFRFSSSGIPRLSIDETARSIEPSRFG